MRKASLGRGLRQLISGNGLAQSRVVIEVSVERLQRNPYQPRRRISPESLSELTESIRAQGILQPLLVRPLGDDYQIVIGERRWRAAQEAGLETVPCIVQEVADGEALELALIENIQREDLSCIEAAWGYRQLVEEFSFTQVEVAERIGKSRSAIANTLRLLQLPEEVQIALSEGRLTEGHGRALLGLVDAPGWLSEVWREVEAEGMSVRETEVLVREKQGKGEREAREKATPTAGEADAHLRNVAERLQEALAMRVTIKAKGDGAGTILIQYHDEEELERLLAIVAPEDII